MELYYIKRACNGHNGSVLWITWVCYGYSGSVMDIVGL